MTRNGKRGGAQKGKKRRGRKGNTFPGALEDEEGRKI